MRNAALFVALVSLPVAVLAKDSQPVAATNPERETGFKDLGECEKAFEGTRKTGVGGVAGRTGSLFNQAQGNTSRCEIVQGEALLVVYPRGHAGAD